MVKEPWLWDISNIEKMIQNKIKESSTLDYKASAALTKNGAKLDISKDISAMANASGGIIIYGVVEEGHLPIKIDEGSNPTEITREWLEQVINSNIQQKINGIKINQIELRSNDNVIYIVWIPRSNRAPHQAADKRYYIRRNFISEPMEDYEIRELMTSKEIPDLTLDLFFWRNETKYPKFALDISNPETLHTLEFNGAIKNEGDKEVNHVKVTLIMDPQLNPHTREGDLKFESINILKDDKSINVYKTDIDWGGPTKMPLFKTIDSLLLENEIYIQFKVPWLREEVAPFVQWEIRAPDMDPKIGTYELRLDGNSIYFKPIT